MNIGIIGGSDGPTAIFVASRSGSFITVAAVIVCVTAFFMIHSVKKRKKGKH